MPRRIVAPTIDGIQNSGIDRPRLRERLKPPLRQRKALQTAQGFTCGERQRIAFEMSPVARRALAGAVRAGGLCVFPAANSFALG
ncbi:MAG TPA: hypothetical protein VFT45_13365, partial [Longimicrobium sp.]|nr:hypothetical protein [Longimicrobium sp.]